MPLIPIDNIGDSRLDCYRDLPQRNLTRQSGLFIAEGEKVVERLVASEFEVASILAEPAFAEKYEPKVARETPIYIASRDLLGDTIGIRFHRAAGVESSAGPRASAKRQERLAILLGSEGHGLGAEWLDLGDRQVTIPMQVGFDSLNVSVAAAVLLYHFCRVNA